MQETTLASYFYYWGKAQKQELDFKGDSYHLLPYHSLDVAAVGVEYLSQHDSLSRFFCEQLDCSREDWLNWAGFWLALHDLGKFSEAFQSQKPELFEQLQGREPNSEKPYSERHDSLGQWYWNDRLADQVIDDGWFIDGQQSSLDCWVRAVTGHHGQPPKASPSNSPSDDYFSKKDRKAIQAFTEELQTLFLTDGAKELCLQLTPIQFESISKALSWWFTGVAVLADWLGSNTDYFPYQGKAIPMQKYWAEAQVNAKKALAKSGVVPSDIKRGLSFNDLFPVIHTASPLQQWAIKVDIQKTPQIFLLEDVTGAGKTEAAITLAYRLMESGNTDGFFVALPTMATANAMYERVSNVYSKLFVDDANLVLAHGSRNLVDDFAKTIIQASKPENDSEQKDETASARCTAWLADHNKRALLAQVGVGTIDQALLGVLHSKHQSLRLLGLFGKVLIVDEVHACDAYMQGVLEVLLEFHARAGGSVILLSATLPVHMKQKLLGAYAKGRNALCPVISEQAYPLATWWQAINTNQLHQEPLATREAVTRTVAVNYQHDMAQVKNAVLAALNAGQCVCWIRNTIADALEAHTLFTNEIPTANITLFHARFCLSDRLDAEELVLHKFGKSSTHALRKGRLVIATQVIEQSLDVDFDLLMSDLAPIDRLVQRAGRLRRHSRDVQGNRLLAEGAADQRGEPCLWVYAPAWTNEPSAAWVQDVLPKAGFVYPDHGQLWLTAKALQSGSFTMPHDARHLIESVFGDDSQIPKGLQQANLTVQGQQMADASHAKNNTLTLVSGYKRGDVMDWWSEAKTPSRLGEQSINVVLARWENERLVPWVKRNHSWAYSTVKITERLMAKAQLPATVNQLVEYNRALESLPDKGKWSLLLPLEQNSSGNWVAQAWTSDLNKAAQLLTWEYSVQTGLQMVSENNYKGAVSE
ncbi:CRISPR-associated helicase Cas3' [Marinomonas sp. A79]|uniref:CRISPR-associated helicase Cas3 n=1 Tax=Marinomonas vulgaris TaxID=2823372 RepID=A0ABS5H7Y1_9GAMM|nr:CRISPR-associated helicase Cas3' [Marinomonas vulgaris]MBR7887434.1 CRISPR-associated helicase Cas3' [Marinomonas vulgaris]